MSTLPQSVEAAILEAVKSLQYGTVEVTIPSLRIHAALVFDGA